ncbi:DUF2795 domain-containing protein [Amycolatopsis sp. NPDC051071]|uniref:DUF2795 domain-containing protein n=1 Tax=Amycolatopsis sp. NPDC051071 TaxID=3154637 RepID=UPI003426B052
MNDARGYLDDVRYPCGRDELLRRAAAQGAGDDVLGHVGKLPEREYDRAETVHRLLAETAPHVDRTS